MKIVDDLGNIMTWAAATSQVNSKRQRLGEECGVEKAKAKKV